MDECVRIDLELLAADVISAHFDLGDFYQISGKNLLNVVPYRRADFNPLDSVEWFIL